MAASGVDIGQDSFSCSICLDLLKDPVSIPCGHSYCMSCVKTHWDGEVGKKYSCPQCRHCFTTRPVLVKNTMLSILMEGLKKSAAPAAPLSPSSAAHGHVLCDLCSETKVKAVKSCLQCLVSYCKEHLQPHYDVPALKKHKLMEPIENLHENMCSVHDEVMKMFCRTDQQCICYLCSLDQHKGHHTVTAAAERTEKQRELQAFQQNILQTISHKEKDLDGLHHHLKNCSGSADAAVELSDRSLKELLHLLEKRISLIKQQVRSQQEVEEQRVKEVQVKVQQEISELKSKLTELDTLSHSEDHVHFLLKFASFSKVNETSESGNSSQSPPPFQDIVTAAVSKLSSLLQETSNLDLPSVSNKTQVKTTAKTDGLPAGAQRAAQHTTAAQQKGQKQPHQEVVPPVSKSSKKKGRQGTQPQQTQQPQTPQGDVPAQSSQKKGQAGNRNQQPATPQKNVPLPSQSSQKKGHTGTQPQKTLQPQVHQQNVPSSSLNSEEWPALTRANLKPKPSTLETRRVPPTENIPLQPSHFTISCPDDLENLELTDLQRYSRRLTFDPQSLNYTLELSSDHTVVRRTSYTRNYSANPARFTGNSQVVTKEILTGRCFWEVHASYYKSFSVAMSYQSIKRQGTFLECAFGRGNEVSWCLEAFSDHFDYYSRTENLWEPAFNRYITFEGSECYPPPTTLGIYLDHDAGILAFYKIFDDAEVVLLYAVLTTFTEPLVAGVVLEDTHSLIRLI